MNFADLHQTALYLLKEFLKPVVVSVFRESQGF